MRELCQLLQFRMRIRERTYYYILETSRLVLMIRSFDGDSSCVCTVMYRDYRITILTTRRSQVIMPGLNDAG